MAGRVSKTGAALGLEEREAIEVLLLLLQQDGGEWIRRKTRIEDKVSLLLFCVISPPPLLCLYS